MRMCPFRAPSAFSTPISRVRCCTLTSMIFISPMPAMPRVSEPINAISTSSAAVMMRNCESCSIRFATKIAL